MPRSHTFAKWHEHANGVHPSDNMRDWLTDRASLTYKLMAHCQQFRVQRLRQQRAMCLADEWREIALPRRLQVQERDVLLRCDGRPMVLGHTVVALDATTTEWPFFSTLGERSLGTTLFGDPLVARGQLQFARLYSSHPLVRRMCTAVGVDRFAFPLWARRSAFRRKTGVMLVTEVFFPEIDELRRVRPDLKMVFSAAAVAGDSSRHVPPAFHPLSFGAVK
ncbi:chorismate lyase family protein [Collimonas arenae]|uniref:Probable chorismate pyruvate-lyase n=1 Tax=Collimonas arenae TaxID=279058 RepID=A0A127PLK6_9BURK|nr:chorismate lyase [Collimonas arenae]AMO98669.1 chorismate lyase family protein [Collimonas arenae]AMP08554.1 chorismate lyase family protein [Collimonas arenae]